MLNGGTHRNESSVLDRRSLQNTVWPDENMVANAYVFRDMHSILHDCIIADLNSFIAN